MKYEDWEREYMRDVIYLGEMKLDLEASWRKEEELKRKPAKIIITKLGKRTKYFYKWKKYVTDVKRVNQKKSLKDIKTVQSVY